MLQGRETESYPSFLQADKWEGKYQLYCLSKFPGTTPNTVSSTKSYIGEWGLEMAKWGFLLPLPMEVWAVGSARGPCLAYPPSLRLKIWGEGVGKDRLLTSWRLEIHMPLVPKRRQVPESKNLHLFWAVTCNVWTPSTRKCDLRNSSLLLTCQITYLLFIPWGLVSREWREAKIVLSFIKMGRQVNSSLEHTWPL